ncbi:LysR family transcriptional regulator [Paracoccus rhizosphaerae]|uniref:LysR family transcriptional regulator n=1 Tax=Paracoccus rhizosphaerae TaxID=1133347 RepID=A0ABV6CDQ1_9RHOB
MRRYYDLPSLSALAVFEAAARHRNLTRAAGELNVTPGAVSRQIKAVESELGCPLFVRRGNGVALTSAGEELFHVLASGFSKLAETARSIKQGDTSRYVAIASSEFFTSMWLIPRMPDFWRRETDINVDHVIWESKQNFRRSDVELRIRYGLGSWVDEHAELLFGDCIYPVCSPDFARRHQGATAADLVNLPLLNVEWVEPDWLGWEEALLRGGVPAGALRARRFGKFGVALQAAMADQGLVIGWHRLIAPLVEQGELVRFTDLVVPAPGGYYLSHSTTREMSSSAKVLREWLLEQARLENARPLPTDVES